MAGITINNNHWRREVVEVMKPIKSLSHAEGFGASEERSGILISLTSKKRVNNI